MQKSTGLLIQGNYRGYLYGNVAGGKNPGAAWDQEWRLTATYDFSFLTHILEGLTCTGGVQWREGQNPNKFVGATPPFQPSTVEGGKFFRLRPFYLTYVTPELFGVKNLLTLSVGWQDPYDIFVQQPLSKLFVNNAIYTTKGLGANIPWSSSYAAWGGYFKVAPAYWHYTQAGLYMAIPEALNAHNHGLDFQGSQIPGKPNSLYFIAETGFTPTIGPGQLVGKYVFGSYWFGASDFDNRIMGPRYGFYWQADQQLYRPPSQKALPPSQFPGGEYQLASSGLYFFSLFTFAPAYNNILTFYFQAGLVYQGLIPKRLHDNISIAYGNGTYSHKFANTRHTPTSQAVLEMNYDIAITKWLDIRPYYQLLINPASDNTVKNAHILGFTIFAAF